MRIETRIQAGAFRLCRQGRLKKNLRAWNATSCAFLRRASSTLVVKHEAIQAANCGYLAPRRRYNLRLAQTIATKSMEGGRTARRKGMR